MKNEQNENKKSLKDTAFEIQNRYSKHILFDKIGKEGQKKLLQSKVLIIGCGGLGCTIVNNLVRAGIGYIRVIDGDFVELDNIQRQILFDEEDAKKKLPKAAAVVEKLKRINSTIEIEGEACNVNSKNIEELTKDMDLVLDGTDNLETRFLINDACIKNSIPWIYGAAVSSIGMTMNIIPNKTPCLKCIINKLPSPGALPTCDTVGILNSVPIIIASIQTTEALKILTNSQEIESKLTYIDVWDGTFDKIEVQPNPECPCCSKKRFEFL